MKQTTFTILLVVAAFILLPSCSKWLEKKSNTSLVVPGTLKDLEGMLNDYYLMNSMTPALGEASTDDFFVSENTYNSYEEELRNVYTWQLEDYNYQNDWSNSYTAVYNSNFCLERVEKVEKTDQNTAQWNYVKGAAHYYRAYWFLNLVWVFAKAYDPFSEATDAGIVLRLGSDYNAKSKRATVGETYRQIVSDFIAAAAVLPDFPPEHVAQPSKAAAYGLLARTYLSMRKYDSAGYYAGLALSMKHDLLDYNDASIDAGSTVPFQPFNKEIIFYSTEWVNYRLKNPSNALTDTLLYNAYNTNDLRKTIFFRPKEGYQRFKGSYASSTSTLFSGLAVDELYLIRAESNARTGKVAAAMDDLNTLLEKRWLTGTFTPLSVTDPAAALQTILEERRKELLFRGLRWPEIKRLNKEGAAIIPKRVIGTDIYTLEPNSGKYALPLPKDIIDLTGMEQN